MVSETQRLCTWLKLQASLSTPAPCLTCALWAPNLRLARQGINKKNQAWGIPFGTSRAFGPLGPTVYKEKHIFIIMFKSKYPHSTSSGWLFGSKKSGLSTQQPSKCGGDPSSGRQLQQTLSMFPLGARNQEHMSVSHIHQLQVKPFFPGNCRETIVSLPGEVPLMSKKWEPFPNPFHWSLNSTLIACQKTGSIYPGKNYFYSVDM